MKLNKFVAPLLALAIGTAVSTLPGRATSAQQMPGPLSAAHASKPGEAGCSACHDDGGRISPKKCLACHGEIASRIAAGTGYHRDKGAGCAVCHAEHQGRQASIVPLEPASFDHAETGADLQGAHLKTKPCEVCHTPANSLPRTQGRSYLLRIPGCRGCHIPPHPGRQEKCLTCHTQESWSVGRRPRES